VGFSLLMLKSYDEASKVFRNANGEFTVSQQGITRYTCNPTQHGWPESNQAQMRDE
jgi:hypothetical protein